MPTNDSAVHVTSYDNDTLGTEDKSERIVLINIGYAIFMPVLAILVIFGNVLIIYAFWKLPSLREKTSELLILNLSIVDLCTGVTLLYISPVFIIRGYNPLRELGCRLANFLFHFTVNAGSFTLVAISMDRLLLVLIDYPKYLKFQSHSRIRFTIALCWITAFAVCAMEHSIWNLAKTLNDSAANIDFNEICLSPPRRLRAFSLFAFIGLYLGPVALVCGLSMTFFVLLWRRIRRPNRVGMLSEDAATDSSVHTNPTTAEERVVPNVEIQGVEPGPPMQRRQQRVQMNRYLKPAVSLTVLVVAMALCMLPYSIYVIIIQFVCSKCFIPQLVNSLLLLQSCNACLDPYLYGMTQKKIRKYYLSCFS